MIRNLEGLLGFPWVILRSYEGFVRRILALITTICLVLHQAHGLIPHHHHQDSHAQSAHSAVQDSSRPAIGATHTHPNWAHRSDDHHVHEQGHGHDSSGPRLDRHESHGHLLPDPATLSEKLSAEIGSIAELCEAHHEIAPHTDLMLLEGVFGKHAPSLDHLCLLPRPFAFALQEAQWLPVWFFYRHGSGSDPPPPSLGRGPPVARGSFVRVVF